MFFEEDPLFIMDKQKHLKIMQNQYRWALGFQEK